MMFNFPHDDFAAHSGWLIKVRRFYNGKERRVVCRKVRYQTSSLPNVLFTILANQMSHTVAYVKSQEGVSDMTI